jgi:hypothetical protein
MKFSVPDYIVLIVADLDQAVQFCAESMGLPLISSEQTRRL